MECELEISGEEKCCFGCSKFWIWWCPWKGVVGWSRANAVLYALVCFYHVSFLQRMQLKQLIPQETSCGHPFSYYLSCRNSSSAVSNVWKGSPGLSLCWEDLVRLRIFQLTLCISKIVTTDAPTGPSKFFFKTTFHISPNIDGKSHPSCKASPAVHSLARVVKEICSRLPAKHASEPRHHTQINHSIVSSQHPNNNRASNGNYYIL